MMSSKKTYQAMSVAMSILLYAGFSSADAINSDNQAKTANLTLAATATWTLTADAYVTTFSDAQADYSNIQSQGHNIYYSKASNPKLNGKTIPLPGGGQLMAK